MKKKFVDRFRSLNYHQRSMVRRIHAYRRRYVQFMDMVRIRTLTTMFKMLVNSWINNYILVSQYTNALTKLAREIDALNRELGNKNSKDAGTVRVILADKEVIYYGVSSIFVGDKLAINMLNGNKVIFDTNEHERLEFVFFQAIGK